MTRPVSLQLNKFALCAQCQALVFEVSMPLTLAQVGTDGQL